MAPSDVVDAVVTTSASYLNYMMPIIGVMCGIIFVTSFVYWIVAKMGPRIFKR